MKNLGGWRNQGHRFFSASQQQISRQGSAEQKHSSDRE